MRELSRTGRGARASDQQGQSGGIVNPKKLTPEQSLEICAQCHIGFSYHADPLPKDLLVSSQVPALRSPSASSKAARLSHARAATIPIAMRLARR